MRAERLGLGLDFECAPFQCVEEVITYPTLSSAASVGYANAALVATILYPILIALVKRFGSRSKTQVEQVGRGTTQTKESAADTELGPAATTNFHL